MKRIGYVKAKTPEQIEAQAKNLLFFGASDIIIEDGSALRDLIDNGLRRGDKLHVTGLDRLSRDVTEVVQILEELYRRGVRLYVGGVKYDLEAFVRGSELIDSLSK